MAIKSFSQRDFRWSEKTIGQSGQTIGRIGCTVTSISMLSTFYGDNFFPNEIVDKCLFTPQGLIIWASCIFPHFKFEWREYNRNEKNIRDALKHPDRSVILQVANKSHWVVAIRSTKPLGIADPWLGDKTTMARYKDNITGAAYFIRT